MGFISDEIREAASTLGFHLDVLPRWQADTLRTDIIRRYSVGHELSGHGHLIGSESVQDPYAWSWLSEFLGTAQVILFFLEDRDPDAWLIPSGEMVVPLLEESFIFVFFLTSPTGEYLLCFNDHDYLIGTGTAAEWIRRLRDRGKIEDRRGHLA